MSSLSHKWLGVQKPFQTSDDHDSFLSLNFERISIWDRNQYILVHLFLNDRDKGYSVFRAKPTAPSQTQVMPHAMHVITSSRSRSLFEEIDSTPPENLIAKRQ